MNVIEQNGVFHCDCGFSWSQGKNGSHNCADGLRKKIQLLVADNEKAMDSLRQADSAVKLAHEKYSAIAAENVGLNKFIKQSCYVYNGDGSDISDSYIPAHESPMMPVQSQSLLPVAAECLAIRDAFIRYLTSENLANTPYADEQQVYDHCAKWVDAMCETPATDAYLAGIKADGVEEWVSSRGGRWNGTTEEALKFAKQLRDGGK